MVAKTGIIIWYVHVGEMSTFEVTCSKRGGSKCTCTYVTEFAGERATELLGAVVE